MEPDRVSRLLEELSSRRVLVIGDVMLDRYVWGRVSRVSPEAPVPVVEVEDEAVRLGGAANVAANVRSLGGRPLLAGLIGPEESADTIELTSIMEQEGLDRGGLIEDTGRRTTVKTRILAHHQHVVRADRESRVPAGGDVAERLVGRILDLLPGVDAVVLEDYNKGVFSRPVLEGILGPLKDSGLPVTVDPKFERFFDFKGVTVFKPNLKEAEAALGVSLGDQESVTEAARHLQRRLEARNVLITRGERGMTLLEEGGEVTHVATRARHVYDVSGAGDTVIATLTAMLAAGAGIREAASLANFAAGVVVAEVGVVPIRPGTLLQAVSEDDV
ncbi:MAG: D-glycero-beta-D-manno-heptose-7-phosphate kinase [bacterium]